ncbi:MAG: hypothetical protein HYV07_08795 [Deltaproteobacteria bacterium]|nr:hypothetical protein [Deltaproteobacteria bacterium]
MKAAAVLTGVLACGTSDFRTLSDSAVPAGINWLAIVPARPGRGSGLVPRGELTSIATFEVAPEAAILVGYRDSDLPRPRPDPSTLRSEELEAASSRGAALPPPSFAARLERPESPIELEYVLTTSWLPDCQTLLEAEALIDADCGPCAARATQSGCAIELPLGPCGFHDLELEVTPTGAARVLDPRGVECAILEGSKPEVITSLDCSTNERRCRADLYGPKRASFETKSQTLATPGPQEELLSEGLGLVGDLAILASGEIAVSTFDGAFEPGPRCARSDRGVVVVLDPRDLSERRRLETSPCPSRLTSLADGSLLLVADSPDRLERIDGTTGERLESVRIPAGDVERHFADLAQSNGRAFVLSNGAKQDDGILHVVDLATFAITATVSLPPQTRPMYVDGGQVRAASNSIDCILEVDESGYRQEVNVPDVCRASNVNSNGMLADGDALFMISHAETPYLYEIHATRCHRAAFFERLADPASVAKLDTQRLWVALTAVDASRDAIVSTYDRTREAFVPGHVAVGRGEIGRMLSSADSVAYVLLREEGKVVRVAHVP